MSGSPYVPFYTSDWLAGTGGMTAGVKGVYITLLCLIYETEAPLPQSHAMLARRCGASNSAFKKALEELIEDGKIEVREDGIWSEKCEKHISTRQKLSSRNAKAAKVRWEKTQEKQGEGDADGMQKPCLPEPEPEPEPKAIKDTNVSLFDAPPIDQSSEAVKLWNEAAKANGWPVVQRMNPNRSKQIKARLRDVGGIDGWRDALAKAAGSDFLCGRTANPWMGFGFDWIVKPANFTKLMEGNYGNRACGNDGIGPGAGGFGLGGRGAVGSHEGDRLRGIAAAVRNPDGY